MLVKLGPIAAAASGSVGSITIANTKYGPIVKHRGLHKLRTSKTAAQAKAHLQRANFQWNALDENDRNAWRDMARITLAPNRLGIPRTVSGYQLFLRHNVPGFTVAYIPAREYIAPAKLLFSHPASLTLTFTDAPSYQVNPNGTPTGTTLPSLKLFVARSYKSVRPRAFRNFVYTGTIGYSSGLSDRTASITNAVGTLLQDEWIAVADLAFDKLNRLASRRITYTQVT